VRIIKKRNNRCWTGCLSGALIVTLSLSLPCQAQPKYNVTDLGVLGTDYHTQAIGINATGQVAGSSTNSSGYTRAFRTAPNAAINAATDDLGTLGDTSSQALGINDAGQVVGVSFSPGSSSIRPFRTSPNTAINPLTDDLNPLGVAGVSWPFGINSIGKVVGFFSPTPDLNRAFRTAPNAAINPATDDLGGFIIVPVGIQASAFGINAIGQAVGWAYAGSGYHAFRTAPNAAINPATDDLGTLGGSEAVGRAINDGGQVVGNSAPPGSSGYPYHAFRTAPNAVINPATDDLGTLGGSASIAFGINAKGQVVGSAQIATGDNHAFVHSGGTMQDLNDQIPLGSGWILQEATGINDVGQIAGYGLHNGLIRAFRLDPIVTYDSLINQVILFVTKPGVAADMIATLQAAQKAAANGNVKLANNQLNSFVNQVRAQSGKAITAAQAAILIELAMALHT